MPTRKRTPKAEPSTKGRTARAAKAAGRRAVPEGYTSPAWERVYLLSVEADALAGDLGIDGRHRDPDGFDLADAARELARLAGNHHGASNPHGRTPAQEKDDWVAVGGLGADLGNMADEDALARVADGVRALAYEVCYLACNYLF